ncbi:probable glutathione S-transferase [Lycium ferocissimum]|uniref:probable glutathione S-transferase n=1 Tax=Lycium ferocissimum TaxID=112874 RepID=UPI00281506C1|nr:probable glutathione S-transferase [Lycium ferocissimum]
MEEVKLHGTSYNLFTYRVIWALKIKGIPFEYIEEEHSDKGSLIMKYNPAFKRFPILFHGEKALSESMVILEYIEDTWPQNPLLPIDPFDRAMARFWVKFAGDKGHCVGTMYYTTGEKQEKAIKETIEMLKMVEEQALGDQEKNFFGGEKIGIVDMAFGIIPHWLEVIEDIVGVKLLEPHSFPRLLNWVQNFKEEQVIKENLPNRDDMFVFLKNQREILLSSS